MLNIVMLSVIMLNVVAPDIFHAKAFTKIDRKNFVDIFVNTTHPLVLLTY
jgi:hypothetical protein